MNRKKLKILVSFVPFVQFVVKESVSDGNWCFLCHELALHFVPYITQ